MGGCAFRCVKCRELKILPAPSSGARVVRLCSRLPYQVSHLNSLAVTLHSSLNLY